MKCQSLYVLLTALLLAAPERGTAQTTTEITVRVPVILTQLAPDVKAVRVTCNLISNELLNATNGNQLMKSGEDITVSGGEVVKVVTIVLTPVLQNPAGKTAGLGRGGWSDRTAERAHASTE